MTPKKQKSRSLNFYLFLLLISHPPQEFSSHFFSRSQDHNNINLTLLRPLIKCLDMNSSSSSLPNSILSFVLVQVDEKMRNYILWHNWRCLKTAFHAIHNWGGFKVDCHRKFQKIRWRDVNDIYLPLFWIAVSAFIVTWTTEV